MNEAIFIDLGGVYFRSAMPGINGFSKKYNIPRDTLYNVLMGENWTRYSTGKSNEKDYWMNISKNLGITLQQAYELRNDWYSYFIPNNNMPNLIRELRRNFYVAILSSQVVGWVEFLEKRYSLSKEFSSSHYSYDYGIDKPDAMLFIQAAKSIHTEPENCIVVDDNKKFLLAVKKTGAKTILFKSASQLKIELKKLGIKT